MTYIFNIIFRVSIMQQFLHYYLCDFVVRDIKIAVYLESPQEINFNLVTINDKV